MSSIPTTSWRLWSSRAARFDPINPATPVTNTLIIDRLGRIQRGWIQLSAFSWPSMNEANRGNYHRKSGFESCTSAQGPDHMLDRKAGGVARAVVVDVA